MRSPDKLANPATYLAMCTALNSSAPEACLAVVEAEEEALDDALEEVAEAADPLAPVEEGFAVVDRIEDALVADAATPVPVVALDTTEAMEPDAELALLADEEP